MPDASTPSFHDEREAAAGAPTLFRTRGRRQTGRSLDPKRLLLDLGAAALAIAGLTTVVLANLPISYDPTRALYAAIRRNAFETVVGGDGLEPPTLSV